MGDYFTLDHKGTIMLYCFTVTLRDSKPVNLIFLTYISTSRKLIIAVKYLNVYENNISFFFHKTWRFIIYTFIFKSSTKFITLSVLFLILWSLLLENIAIYLQINKWEQKANNSIFNFNLIYDYKYVIKIPFIRYLN